MLNRSDILSICGYQKESIIKTRDKMTIDSEVIVCEVTAYYDAKQTKSSTEYIYMSYGELKFVDKDVFDAYEKTKIDKIHARMKECRTTNNDPYKEVKAKASEESLKKFEKVRELKSMCKGKI